MRPPHELRRELIRLRDRNRLTYTTICERARISRNELYALFNMRATEDTQIKVEAFLNAPPKFHRRPQVETKIMYEMENLSREAWREFKVKSPHPDSFRLKTKDQQRAAYNAVTFSCKKALQKRVETDYGIQVRMSDGQNYWQFKQTCLRRIRREEALRTGDRNAHYLSWPPPGSQGERLQPRADENGGDAGVVGGGRPPA